MNTQTHTESNISDHFLSASVNVTVTENGFTDTLIPNSVIVIFQWLVIAILCQAVSVFGVVSNIINIICFVKQHFNDPVNVSLLGLAVSDLCSLLTLIWTNICFNPAFMAADVPFDPQEFQYLTGAMPHTTFTRITAWITALITLERCLCITAPLKVKGLITSRRVIAIITAVFILLIASVAPLYVANKLDLKFSPARNKTILGLVYADNRESIEQISFAINNTFIPFSAFVVIITCTVILVIRLHSNTEWRKKSVTLVQADSVSTRNQKIAKMVTIISALFIACFIPISILFMAMSVVPELSIVGKYRNAVIVIGGLGIVLESINSSVNIFIYYHMSSKFRIVFQQLFGKFDVFSSVKI